ncbi:CPBP family intramembrane glutamic endopeptidase [Enterococcus sp. DIV0800]|uniref:CPBP family intramembrane glutamic endopeptidase n=1 Tax=unclassified Enterococcus TaxID=2608891 RepID=UPI003D2FB4EC
MEFIIKERIILQYIKNFFIVLALFVLSQLSMTVFSIVQLSLTKPLSGLGLLVMFLFVFANIALLLWLAKRLKLIQLNFSWVTRKNILIILGATLLLRLVAIGGTLLIQQSSGQQTSNNDAMLNTMFHAVNPALLFLLIAISAPIMEEIVFRAGIIKLLCRKLPILGIALSSICFGMMHMTTDIPNFFLYASMGLVLSIAYYKSASLEVSIMVHFLNNAMASIAMILMQ